MKRISMLFICAAALLPIAVPVFSDEGEDTSRKSEQNRDECLLLARRCGTAAYSIQDKVEKLKEEIEKGKKSYSVEELNILRQKLDDANRTLDYLRGM